MACVVSMGFIPMVYVLFLDICFLFSCLFYGLFCSCVFYFSLFLDVCFFVLVLGLLDPLASRAFVFYFSFFDERLFCCCCGCCRYVV